MHEFQQGCKRYRKLDKALPQAMYDAGALPQTMVNDLSRVRLAREDGVMGHY